MFFKHLLYSIISIKCISIYINKIFYYYNECSVFDCFLYRIEVVLKNKPQKRDFKLLLLLLTSMCFKAINIITSWPYQAGNLCSCNLFVLRLICFFFVGKCKPHRIPHHKSWFALTKVKTKQNMINILSWQQMIFSLMNVKLGRKNENIMKKEQKQSDLIAKKGMIEIQEMRNTFVREEKLSDRCECYKWFDVKMLLLSNICGGDEDRKRRRNGGMYWKGREINCWSFIYLLTWVMFYNIFASHPFMISKTLQKSAFCIDRHRKGVIFKLNRVFFIVFMLKLISKQQPKQKNPIQKQNTIIMKDDR